MMSWLSRLWATVRGGVVGDVPPGLSACEHPCRRCDCTQSDFERCPDRAAAAEAEQQAASSDLEVD